MLHVDLQQTQYLRLSATHHIAPIQPWIFACCNPRTFRMFSKPACLHLPPQHPAHMLTSATSDITNLPENYFCKYYMYHALSWPQLSYVAVDVRLHVLQAFTPIHLTQNIRRPPAQRRHPTMRRKWLDTSSRKWKKTLKMASHTATSHRCL